MDSEQRQAKAKQPAEEALRLHALYRGKIQMMPKCPIEGAADFAYWYTPGVAVPCLAIQADPAKVYEFTNKGNMVAVISDGSRVLGLGNIGPLAGLPVMEGKALLFKYLGGVDAVPLCLGTQEPAEFVRAVQLLAPSFGGINLEDIAQPRCFRVLEELRRCLAVPVWHDDQQGTATAVLAGLVNALKVVGKPLESIRISMIGMGAANVANFRLLRARGVQPEQVVACDTRGTLHRNRPDLEKLRLEFPEKWSLCQETNREGITGGIAEALRGADVCIAFSASGPGILRPDWIRAMAKDAIVFACANPTPETWPGEAKEAGARIVATGRGDFANQVNNSLVFPGMFRGTLDAQARAISEEMALAAADELARCAEDGGLDEDHIVPSMSDWRIVPRVAAAVALTAQQQGLARVSHTREEYIANATQRISAVQEMLGLLMREGRMTPVPPL